MISRFTLHRRPRAATQFFSAVSDQQGGEVGAGWGMRAPMLGNLSEPSHPERSDIVDFTVWHRRCVPRVVS